MLCDIFPERDGLVHCEEEVGTMAKKLFENTPSLIEYYQCEDGCKFSNKFGTLALEKSMLHDFSNNFRTLFMDRVTKSHNETCRAPATLAERYIGKLTFFPLFVFDC